MALSRQLLTKLEDVQIQKLEIIRSDLNLNKSDFISHVLDNFESKNRKKIKYQLKYTEFDRVKLINYPCNLVESLHQRLYKISNELHTNKFQLIREILLHFIEGT